MGWLADAYVAQYWKHDLQFVHGVIYLYLSTKIFTARMFFSSLSTNDHSYLYTYACACACVRVCVILCMQWRACAHAPLRVAPPRMSCWCMRARAFVSACVYAPPFTECRITPPRRKTHYQIRCVWICHRPINYRCQMCFLLSPRTCLGH